MIFKLLLMINFISIFTSDISDMEMDVKVNSCYYCAEESKEKCKPINKRKCEANENLCYVGLLTRANNTIYVAGCVSDQHRIDSEESCDFLNIKYRIIYCNFDNCNTLDQL